MRRWFTRAVLCCVLALLMGCDGYDHATIPTVKVNFTIYPDDVGYAHLNYIGGHEYLTGGVAGIIVYRVDMTTFVAYDRACPYDWDHADAWLEVDESGIIIIDRHCGSRFNILDGAVINGPAQYPLKFYRTTYDGRRLRIYN